MGHKRQKPDREGGRPVAKITPYRKVALLPRLRRLCPILMCSDLEPIYELVHIKQKRLKYSPVEKLTDALIAILAQMGSFVPAKSARIGIIDRLFSRVGAADDLARGRSTFMVEMVETAAILNQAGERALVILDEIGRGTATFDGLSIAWATVEHLHDVNRCRALFATHFHELTRLSSKLERLHNATVRVKEWDGEVVFLHEVVAGAADRSYGIQVAKLAGLPPSVIERAKLVLAKLEQDDRSAAKDLDDLPLFARSGPPQQRQPVARNLVADTLDALNPDELSPREALEALYVLKGKLQDTRNS